MSAQPTARADLLRNRLTLGGVAVIGAAAVAAEAAWLHMSWAVRTYGVICGAGLPHCPACPAAAALGLLGAGLLIAGRRRA